MFCSSRTIRKSIGDTFTITIVSWGITSISTPDPSVVSFISRVDVPPPVGMAGAGTETTLTYQAIGDGSTSIEVTGNVADFPDVFDDITYVNVGDTGIALVITAFMLPIMMMVMMFSIMKPMVKSMSK